MKKNLRRAGNLIIFAALIAGCSGLIKVPVEYRYAPIIEGLNDKSILVARIANFSQTLDTSRDIEVMLIGRIQEDKIFREVKQTEDFKLTPDSIENTKTVLDAITPEQWQKLKDAYASDYIICGSVMYGAKDFAIYQNTYEVNEFGYRVPVRGWKDNLAYSLDLRLYMIDLSNGHIVASKDYKDSSTVEGAADEVSVFMIVAREMVNEFMELILGDTVDSTRYLILK